MIVMTLIIVVLCTDLTEPAPWREAVNEDGKCHILYFCKHCLMNALSMYLLLLIRLVIHLIQSVISWYLFGDHLLSSVYAKSLLILLLILRGFIQCVGNRSFS